MKVNLTVEKRGADVEFRAEVVHEVNPEVVPMAQIIAQDKIDVVALPAVFQAHSINRHVRPAPLLAIPLADAVRLAKTILGMDRE